MQTKKKHIGNKKQDNTTIKRRSTKNPIHNNKINNAELEHKAQTTNIRREFFKSLVADMSRS